MGDSGASNNYTNDRTRGINIHEGGNIGPIGTHGEAMTASVIMDITGIWCKFGREQLRGTLKDVQYKPKSNILEKPLRRAGSLVAINNVW